MGRERASSFVLPPPCRSVRVRCVGLKAFSAAIDLHYSLTISLAPPLALGAAVEEQGPTGVHVLRLHASTHGIALVGMCVAVSAGAFIAHRPALNTDGRQSKTDEEVNDGSPVKLRCCNAHLHLLLCPRHPLKCSFRAGYRHTVRAQFNKSVQKLALFFEKTLYKGSVPLSTFRLLED